MKKTQKERILELLKDGEWHSNIEIHEKLFIWRVSARIWDLEHDGYTIERRNGKGSLYWYRLVSEPKQLALSI